MNVKPQYLHFNSLPFVNHKQPFQFFHSLHFKVFFCFIKNHFNFFHSLHKILDRMSSFPSFFCFQFFLNCFFLLYSKQHQFLVILNSYNLLYMCKILNSLQQMFFLPLKWCFIFSKFLVTTFTSPTYIHNKTE